MADSVVAKNVGHDLIATATAMNMLNHKLAARTDNLSAKYGENPTVSEVQRKPPK